MSALTDAILDAAGKPRRPHPGETCYVVRKKLANTDYIPEVPQLISTCYTRRVQLNGIRIIVMGPGVNDFTGEGVFCTYSAHEVFLNYAEALEFSAGIIQEVLTGVDEKRQRAANVLRELKMRLELELAHV